jgi:alpha/beta superfamily hydrolase
MSSLRVQFIHGLESSPSGIKARLFAEHFTAITPAMDTRDFDSCVVLQERTIAEFRPDVLVGSSFGGAVAVELLHRGVWRGPTLLLAQAALRFARHDTLPEGIRVWLVHGTADTVVDVEDSRRLARTGSSDLVRLIEVDDDHSLHQTVTSGALLHIVRDLARAG